MISQGKLTKEDIEEAKQNSGRLEHMRIIAQCLYIILSDSQKAPEDTFIKEIQSTDPWEGPSHKKWMEYAESIMEECLAERSTSDTSNPIEVIAEELAHTIPDVLGKIEYSLSEFSLRVLQTRLSKFYSNCGLEPPMELPLPHP